MSFSVQYAGWPTQTTQSRIFCIRVLCNYLTANHGLQIGFNSFVVLNEFVSWERKKRRWAVEWNQIGYIALNDEKHTEKLLIHLYIWFSSRFAYCCRCCYCCSYYCCSLCKQQQFTATVHVSLCLFSFTHTRILFGGKFIRLRQNHYENVRDCKFLGITLMNASATHSTIQWHCEYTETHTIIQPNDGWMKRSRASETNR